MPPKPKSKELQRKTSVVRRPISASSLVYVPEDVVEGFEERLETGIVWTDQELGLRHHRKKCRREDNPTVTFSQGLQNKIKKSVLKGLLEDEDSNISLEHELELIFAITLWDVEKFANDEGKICFACENSITENIVQLFRKVIKHGDRKYFMEEIKKMLVLRVNGVQITELDEGLRDFKKLTTLNLCGNFIENLDASLLPPTLRSLELQCNAISDILSFAVYLPSGLLYLGLAGNFLRDESIIGMGRLPYNLKVLDLADNDIYNLELLLNELAMLPHLVGLQLAGNPCSFCSAYALCVTTRLTRLMWLDSREILLTDRPLEPVEIHPDDLRSTYFYFTVFRIISAPPPPKPEKGAVATFHVELDIPLLDSARRRFLMYRRNESLIELLPPPEDWSQMALPVERIPSKTGGNKNTISTDVEGEMSVEFNIYDHLVATNPLEIKNYTTFESNRISYNKIMTFQDPTVKIFCPDLALLRSTFRSTINVRFVYTLSAHPKQEKKKSTTTTAKAPLEQRVVIASIQCALKNLDWTHPSQHFHWDDTFENDYAMHWGDGDLSVLQYGQASAKSPKGKQDGPDSSGRMPVPENLTCQFGFSIDTLKVL